MNMEVREQILELYADKKMSGIEISKKLGIPQSTLYQAMDKLKIKTRTLKKARLNFLKKNKRGRYKVR